jgi:hypothetical protein
MIARTLSRAMLAVYTDDIGRHVLGHILARGLTGFEAFDSADRSIGIFNSQSAAAIALGDRP